MVTILTNAEVKQIARERAIAVERAAGRTPVSVPLQTEPYDLRSDGRRILVRGFGGSARGAPMPLEQRQVEAWRADPQHYYVYVVDNIRFGPDAMTVRVLHGDVLTDMVARTPPVLTYWPTLRVDEYDAADQLSDPR